jgi:hypothetical protein
MRIKYCKETDLGPTIEFTESGHVDMDVFDESDNTVKDTLAVFHDEDVEKLCRPIIENYIKDLQKKNDDDIDLEREESNDKDLGIEFFWKTIVPYESGFSTEELGWDDNATDRNGNEYEWENDGFLKQIPKQEDFKSALSIFVKQEFECFINHRFDGDIYLFLEEMLEDIEKGSKLYHELYFISQDDH